MSDTVKGYDSAHRYSFFMGVILCPEIERILSLHPNAVTVGGKQQIREAICILLSQFGTIPVYPLSNDTIDTCVPLGAIRIYEFTA